MRKKGKTLIVMTIIVVLIFSAVLVESYIAKVPDLNVEYGGNNIIVMKGSYCWRSIFKGLCVDTIGPQELIAGIYPTEVQSEDKLELNFSQKPTEVRVEMFGDNEQLKYDGDGYLEIPIEHGIHIINVYARWKNGSVAYVFTINIIE